jgi:hypothetical protein
MTRVAVAGHAVGLATERIWLFSVILLGAYAGMRSGRWRGVSKKRALSRQIVDLGQGSPARLRPPLIDRILDLEQVIVLDSP